MTNYQKVTCNIIVEKKHQTCRSSRETMGFLWVSTSMLPVPTSYFGRFSSLKRKEYQNRMLIQKAGVRVYSSQEHDGTGVLNNIFMGR